MKMMMTKFLLPPSRLQFTGLALIFLALSRPLVVSGSPADDEKEMANYVKALRKELFETRPYDPTISPFIFYSENVATTNVSLGLDLFYVIDLDTTTSILETSFVLKLGWLNENLTWLPDNFGGLELLHLNSSEIFKPDIYVSNALVEENLLTSSTHSDLLLSAEGELFWAPVITLRTLCPPDLSSWPADRQTCQLRFVSGSFFVTEVFLFNSSDQIETGNLKPNPMWAVVDTGVHYRSETYYDLIYTLTLQRTSDVFAWAISVPLYAALALNLGTFFLLLPGPSSSSSSSLADFRFSLVRLAFITLILLSLYVATQLGGVVGVLEMPKIVTFIGRNIVLLTANLIWSAFLRSSSAPKAPADLVSLLLRPLERLLGGEVGESDGGGDSTRLVEEVDELPAALARRKVQVNGSPSRVTLALDKLLFVVSLIGMFLR